MPREPGLAQRRHRVPKDRPRCGRSRRARGATTACANARARDQSAASASGRCMADSFDQKPASSPVASRLPGARQASPASHDCEKRLFDRDGIGVINRAMRGIGGTSAARAARAHRRRAPRCFSASRPARARSRRRSVSAWCCRARRAGGRADAGLAPRSPKSCSPDGAGRFRCDSLPLAGAEAAERAAARLVEEGGGASSLRLRRGREQRPSSSLSATAAACH
jgi:hypothetical protein